MAPAKSCSKPDKGVQGTSATPGTCDMSASTQVLPTRGASSKSSVVRQVGTHCHQHGMRYTYGEWEAMKPLLQRLYLETGATLDQVSRILAEQYNFHPPQRMYKYRFAEWGWRKNVRRQANAAGQNEAPVRTSRPPQRRRLPASESQVQHMRTPNTLRAQELVAIFSRDFTSAQFHRGWTVGPLTISHQQYTPKKLPFFLEAQTQLQYSIHQLKTNRVTEAYQLLGGLFDFITGSEVYLHPKFVLSWALTGSVFFDMCNYARDKDYALVRALMRFSGANASAVFGTTDPTHPIMRLMRTVAANSSESPEQLRNIFRNASAAAADGLQQTLGPLHPTALFAQASVAWYWGVSDAQMAQLLVRYPAALVSADVELGPHSDVSIGICYDFTHFVFCHQRPSGTADDTTKATTRTRTITANDVEMLASDLLQRTKIFTTGQILGIRSETLRAHGFACLLHGIFALEEGKPDECRAFCDGAISWLRQGGAIAQMLADMLEADLVMLMEAWAAGRGLRKLDLNFGRPRWFDGEKEMNVSTSISVAVAPSDHRRIEFAPSEK